MLSFFIVLVAAMLASLVIVRTQHWHEHVSADSTFGVQKIHEDTTPRIGGIAVVMGLTVKWLLAGPEVRAVLSPMLLAAVPAFAFGLTEDFTKRVGVLPRLLATCASGILVCLLTGVAMQNTGFAPLDWLLQWFVLATLFTAFAIGGVANAVNIIDGFNGLAAGSLAIMLGAMGLIAMSLGDAPVATVCFALVACSLGFGLVNWPMGRLFLGDGGAYLMGFMLAWMAVLLPMRHPLQLNAWTTLLVCAYPVLEVAFSVQRRIKRQGHHPGQPDRSHLHHFIHRRFVCLRWPQLSTRLQNGLTSPFCWLLSALPAGLAVLFAQNTFALGLCLLGYAALYALIYRRLTQFAWFR